MAVFSFFEEVGAQIFSTDKEKEETHVEVTDAKKAVLEKQNKAAAEKLLHKASELKLNIESPVIHIKAATATLYGLAETQDDREKMILLVGNSKGVAKVDDRIAVKEEAPESSFYTVQRGDNLSKIAKEHYDNANKYKLIFEANKPMLEDPDKIFPGQVLRIPPREKK